MVLGFLAFVVWIVNRAGLFSKLAKVTHSDHIRLPPDGYGYLHIVEDVHMQLFIAMLLSSSSHWWRGARGKQRFAGRPPTSTSSLHTRSDWIPWTWMKWRVWMPREKSRWLASSLSERISSHLWSNGEVRGIFSTLNLSRFCCWSGVAQKFVALTVTKSGSVDVVPRAKKTMCASF